jgi:hypothetical protein
VDRSTMGHRTSILGISSHQTVSAERGMASHRRGHRASSHGRQGRGLTASAARLRGNYFPEPSAYRQQRELAEQAHQLASQVGLWQAAHRLGIHREALKAAFTQWGLPALERRVGWQPSRLLADRAEAGRAFALAEQLGRCRGCLHGELTFPIGSNCGT